MTKPTDQREHEQAAFLQMVRDAGGVGIFATCVEDVDINETVTTHLMPLPEAPNVELRGAEQASLTERPSRTQGSAAAGPENGD